MLFHRFARPIVFLSALATSAVVSFVALSASAEQKSEEPDLRKEKRLHDTYQKYYSHPTRSDQWTGALSGKSMTYQIQQSDTLWDMSEVLFGDPGFWPKIWSLNAEKIENPHEIYPGQTLKFAPGSLTQPPSLAIAKAGEKVEETVAVAAPLKEQIENKKDDQPNEDIPALDPKKQELLALAGIPPEPTPKPVGQFPGSIPQWSFGKRQQTLVFQSDKIPHAFPPAEEPLSYYISTQSPVSVGTIVEGEMGQSTLAEFQYMSVKLAPGTTQKRLVVMREQDEITDPESKEAAKIIQIQGEIDVLDVVNTDENIYRAIVRRVVTPIQVGATLVAEPLPKFRAKNDAIGSGLARVIGGQHGQERHLIEQNSLVYLSGTGLSEGQSYPIYKQQILRQEKTRSFENPLRIGTVKVLKVSNHFATGVVVDEHEEIHVGDVTDPHMRTTQ